MQDEEIDLGLKVLLAEEYSRCATENAEVNRVRNAHVNKGQRLALIAVVCLVAACPGYLEMKSDLPEKTTNLRSVNHWRSRNERDKQKERSSGI